MFENYCKNIKEILLVTILFICSFFIFISTSLASSSVPNKWGRCANNTDGSLHVCDPDLVSALNYDFPVSFETKDMSRQYSYLVNVPMMISSGTELITYDFTIRLENNTSINFYLFGVHSTKITTSWKSISNCNSLVSVSVWGSTPSSSSCSLSIRKADSSNAIYDIRVSGTVQYKNALNASSNGFRVRLGTYSTSGTTIENSMLTTSSLGTNRIIWDFTSFNYSTSNRVDLSPIVDGQQQTNEKLDNIDNTMKDDDIDTSQSNSFFDGFTDTDHGGISGVVTAPLRFINRITDKCIQIDFVIFEKEISLPCGDTLFWNRPEVQEFRAFWNILVGGPIIYALLVALFKIIEKMKNPENNGVEVMKL